MNTQYRQLGHESEEEKDDWDGSYAIYEGDSPQVQERIPDWCTEGCERDEGDFFYLDKMALVKGKERSRETLSEKGGYLVVSIGSCYAEGCSIDMF